MPPKKHADHTYFNVIDTEEKAYWVGFLAADGCISDSGRLSLSLSSRDKSHVERFRAALQAEHTVHVRPHGSVVNGYLSQPAASFSIRSKQLSAGLAACELGPRKSLTCRAWIGPPELMRHYWRGVVDGDGWIVVRNRAVQVGLIGSSPMIDSFQKYVVAVTGTKAQPKQTANVFRFTVGSYPANRLLHELYDNCTVALPRKLLKAMNAISVTPETPQKFDWTTVSKTMLLDSFARLGRWSLVAKELGVPLNTLLIYRRTMYGIRSRDGCSGSANVRHCGRASTADGFSRAELLRLHATLGTWLAVSRHIKASKNTIRDRLRRP